MIKTILVPYDGSSCSKKALNLAKDISRNFTADLLILSVIPTYYSISDSVFAGAATMNYQNVIEDLTRKTKEVVDKVARKLREEGTKVTYKITEGDISNSILKEAKKTRADLIIMGSRRMTGVNSLKRLGSTARHVSEYAPCPVTIVH